MESGHRQDDRTGREATGRGARGEDADTRDPVAIDDPVAAREEDDLLGDPDETSPAASDGPSPQEWSALARLRSSHDWAERMHALSDLLRGHPKLAYAAFRPPFSDHAEVEDPDLRCFLIAQELSAQMNGRVPPVLASFLERSDLDPRSCSQLESALAEQVEAWVGVPAEGRSRSLRLEFQLERSSETGTAVSLVVRVSSLRLGDEVRTGGQLRALLNEARREPGLLAPEQLELLELLLDPLVAPRLRENDTRFILTGAPLLRVLLSVTDSGFATWTEALDPELAAVGGVEARRPLRMATGSLDVGPVLSNTETGPRVVLEQRFPDGRVVQPEKQLVIRSPAGGRREPTLVLTEGAFWVARGDPPPPLPELFAAAGGLDPSRRRSRTLLDAMARAFPDLRESLTSHSRVHAVRPAVCLDLREDDWIQVRAFASGVEGWRPGDVAEPGSPIFEWTPDGRWIACGAQPSDDETAPEDPAPIAEETARLAPVRLAEEDPLPEPDGATHEPAGPIWLEYPDPERVEPMMSWLDALGARSGARPQRGGAQPTAADRNVGGWVLLDAHTARRFAEAWEDRPPGVDWYGNDALRQLLEAPAPVAPKLQVAAHGLHWFTVSAAWEAEAASLSDADLASLRASSSPFVRLASGWTSRARVEAQDQTEAWLADLGIEIGAEEQQVSLWQLAQARPEALAFLGQLDGGDEAREKLQELREKVAAFEGLPRVPVPDAIRGTLRPYQREGLDFLVHASGLDLGVILADDMGLGKTLQALAWLAHQVHGEPEGGPTLVVCPASVLHNWEREAARFAPSLKVLVLAAGEARHALRDEIPTHDLVLTNYSLLRRDREELGAISWRAVILDEAQNIKNPDAAVSRAARALTARHRLALTGTPLENRALDLWSIQAFLNPGYLGPRAPFVKRYDQADVLPQTRRLLASKLRPVLLRRLKKQVAPELPPRIEEQRDCELSEGQRKLYLAELARGRSLLGELSSTGDASNRFSILAVLTRLRQICCHPALVGGDDALVSGKFAAFFELLEPLRAEGHKVLVFSQFVECLQLVARDLRERDIPYHMLTGSSRNRGDIVAAFEDDPAPSPFLISLKAGGTGLNLTAANYVVLFDPWWNPAVEAQAIDRTHRIGQDRTVIAYRMVSQGTIEERIRELQERKASLAHDVLGEDGFGKALSRDDLDYLLADVTSDAT